MGCYNATINDEALVKSPDGEISRLRSALTIAKKEKEEATTGKEKIQQKAFDDVYSAHEAGFNHCLWHVLHLCEVSDPGVFDINKDVYHGGWCW